MGVVISHSFNNCFRGASLLLQTNLWNLIMMTPNQLFMAIDTEGILCIVVLTVTGV